MSMAKLVEYKEILREFYEKYDTRIDAVVKMVVSFFSLLILQNLFHYGNSISLFLILGISVLQGFLPISVLFYTAAVVILYGLSHLSVDVFLGVFAVLLIYWLAFVRVDQRYASIAVFMTVLCCLKLEYLAPVILGITVGYYGILPAAGGILFYYIGQYVASASALILSSDSGSVGIGVERVVSLMMIDRKMLVELISFCIVIFIVSYLYRLFYEKAWGLAIMLGSISLAILLISGKMIFSLDSNVWRILLGVFGGMLIALVVQFFKGIGDITRMEKATFEDDTYIYFVKAVPKIKVSHIDRNVQMIHPEKMEEEEFSDEVADKVFGQKSEEESEKDGGGMGESDKHLDAD